MKMVLAWLVKGRDREGEIELRGRGGEWERWGVGEVGRGGERVGRECEKAEQKKRNIYLYVSLSL